MAASFAYPPFPGQTHGNEVSLPPNPYAPPQTHDGLTHPHQPIRVPAPASIPQFQPPLPQPRLHFQPPPLLDPFLRPLAPTEAPPPSSTGPRRRKRNAPDPDTILPTAPREPEAHFIPPFTRPPSAPSTPLSVIPPQISHTRNLLFHLSTPLSFTSTSYAQYWPFIDNVWSLHQRPKPAPTTGIARVYGACRLQRKVNYPDLPPGSRPRARRDHGICKATIRVSVFADGSRLVELTSAVGHSHDLEFLDAVKRCSGVRGIVLDPFFKSWEAGGILAYLKDSAAGVVESGDGEGEHQDGAGGGATSSGSEFVDAGGLHICRQEVQNILNSAIRRAHPGQDVSFVKKQMDKYKKFVTCTNKGCNASAFPDIRALMEHRKQAHGVKIHDHSDKLYGCPDKTCWRKKKSKGFSTLLSLEEHVKEKHPERVTADGLDLGENGGVLPVSEDVLTPTENGGEFATVHSTMSNGQHQTPDKGFRSDLFSPEDGRFGGYGGYGAMQVDTPQHQRNHQVEPITPDSTAALEAQMIAELSAPAEAEMSQPPSIEPQAPTPLTYAERQKMKLRISQLKAERVKLDNEIARLTRRVWPNEGVETGGAQENG